MIAKKFHRNLRYLGTLFLGVSLIFLYYQFYILKPNYNKNYEIGYKLLPEFTISDNEIKVKNLRDFKYSKGKIESESYLNKSFDLNKLERVWFIFEPFSKYKPVAHTFLIFDFEGSDPVAINAEARREIGEAYSSADLFWSNVNKYELIYIWGTEKDVTGMRSIYTTEPLHMFPLNIKKEDAKKLFIELAKNSQKLENEPAFYNLILRSCNNELAYTANKLWPNIIPSHYSIYAPGYAPEYLYKLGFIPNDMSYDELKEKSYISDFYVKNYGDKDFSKKLRDYLKSQSVIK